MAASIQIPCNVSEEQSLLSAEHRLHGANQSFPKSLHGSEAHPKVMLRDVHAWCTGWPVERWSILLYGNIDMPLPNGSWRTIALCSNTKRMGSHHSDPLVAVVTGVGPQSQPPGCWVGRDKKNTAHFPCEMNYKNKQRKKRKMSTLNQMFSYF